MAVQTLPRSSSPDSVCESARGSDADRRAKMLIHFAIEGSLFGAHSQSATRCRFRLNRTSEMTIKASTRSCSCASAAKAASNSPTLRASAETNATDVVHHQCGIGPLELPSTPTRDRLGTASARISSCLGAVSSTEFARPVMFPPGFAKCAS
jgi:hypothetical protein